MEKPGFSYKKFLEFLDSKSLFEEKFDRKIAKEFLKPKYLDIE